MTLPPDWSVRGRELGATLDERHAIVVIGTDATAVAEVALGMAMTQSKHRRVAVGDLFGEAPPLQALVTTDDPHGIVDSFLYGVSLNRIAHAVPDAGELFVMPTGTGPIDYDELFGHPRWRRLAAGFREVGALLILVAPAAAARLDELVAATDGAVIVGDTGPSDLPVAQAIAWLRPSRGGATASAGGRPSSIIAAARPARGRRSRKAKLATASGVLLAASLALLALWIISRPPAAPTTVRPSGAATVPIVGATAGGATSGPAAPNALGDNAPLLTLDQLREVSDSFPVLAPSNPQDSAAAAAFAVRLQQTNTKSGAILDLGDRFKAVPAGTYGYDVRTRFFLLVAGAYPTRAGAESLLTQLRTRKLLASGLGSITSLPFAFMVQADVPAAEIASRLARYQARAEPVYALRQPSGTAHLYYGAYESAAQAALAVPSVREAGITPTLVYRIGRVF